MHIFETLGTIKNCLCKNLNYLNIFSFLLKLYTNIIQFPRNMNVLIHD